MNQKPGLTAYLLIIAFAAAVVALGLQELNLRHINSWHSRGRARKEIVQELKGSSLIERAQFDPEAFRGGTEKGNKLNQSDRSLLSDLITDLFQSEE